MRSTAYANGGKLRVRTDQEPTALERMLAAAGQLHHLLQCLHPIGIARARRAPAGLPRADAIKRANPASWKHVNLYGAYSFLDIGDGGRPPGIDQSLGGSRGRGATAPD